MHIGLEGLIVKGDGRHPPHDHARALHRRVRLEAADIVKPGRHRIGRPPVDLQQIARLERQKQQGGSSQHNEYAHPQIDFSLIHLRQLQGLMPSGAEHHGGQHKIQCQYRQRSNDHGARGGPRNAFGRRLTAPALQQRDEGDGQAEHHAFDHPITHILEHIDAALHLRPELPGIDADHHHPHHIATHDAHRAEHSRQQGHDNHTSPEPRSEHAHHRIDGHHLHRRNLLAGLHQADFGSQRGARATGKQQGGDDGPELAHQRQRHQHPQRARRTVTRQGVVTLQPEHEADEQTRHRNDDQRQIAEKIHLLNQQAGTHEHPADQQNQPREQARRITQAGQQLPRAGADGNQSVSHRHARSLRTLSGRKKSSPIAAAG